MSIVSLLGINVLNNPARFTDPYEFEITFECLEPLKEDLEWKLTYVGSSRSLEHDQELDSILVGPVPVGVNKFLFTADPPSADLIPSNELVSVTVILLSCSYANREFVRVGYYVNNEYDSEELRENPPNKVQVEHVVRNILAEKPRVTRFNIVWDNENAEDEFPPEQPEADLVDDDVLIGDEDDNDGEGQEDGDEDDEEEEDEEDDEEEAEEEAEEAEEEEAEEEEAEEEEEVNTDVDDEKVVKKQKVEKTEDQTEEVNVSAINADTPKMDDVNDDADDTNNTKPTEEVTADQEEA
ncbi:CYFA0S12e01156g1_1 [Cyberlindnera fabianii]|uniref:Histone chaperone n=1 Tax=Cyberlindnera fabianii TaxID=36022 RepID=A0A061B253_CYBFA|nr:Histone chaperone ASF1 [Cyberlindnera fabianii]CDR43502.1 CYFA0S12e01156g1_1 [Cyberlindnera fabianii]